MEVTKSLALGLASFSTFHETTSPQAAELGPLGPCIWTRIPVLLASHWGSFLHCGQVGSASLRRPASSSSKKEDQITMAAFPAKYVARVVSASWLPLVEVSLLQLAEK